MSNVSKAAGALAALLLLSACAGEITERGLADVSAVTEEKVGRKVDWQRDDAAREAARARVRALLARPVDADAAVELAFLNSRGLQADLAEIGIAAADLAAASRPPNPGFSFARTTAGGVREIERTLTGDVLGLLTWPIAAKIEERRFEQATWAVAGDVLRKAAETRRAWFRAVAAAQVADYVAQAKEAAEAQAELARRMARAGNFSALDQAREQAFYAETTAALARARLMADGEKLRLARLLGLWGEDLGFKLPPRLPDLPEQPMPGGELEQKAIAERLDIRRAQKEVAGLADSLGLTHITRFVNLLEASYLRNKEEGSPRETGYEIHIEVPIFDFGSARVAKAEAVYQQGVDRLAEIAIGARTEVRETYAGYRTALDLARHWRQEIVPVRQRISEEMLLRYNGMLVSVFELLSDSRDQIAAVISAIEAQRDFWLAETDLRFALITDTATIGAPASPRLAARAGGGH
ncbi:TolC family protein [Desertibaculum subflavum]|uniref:TolC family protein n=1 Tax=Desertibaculum subflavum TaxID=2268458 RepID=UPI000E6624C1